MPDVDPRAALPDALRGIEALRLTSCDLDDATWTVRLGYALDDAVAFTETIELPAPADPSAVDHAALDGVLRLLHLAAGTSYFKAAAPPVVRVETGPLTGWERAVAEHCYDQGMREFAHRAGLGVPVAVAIDAPDGATPALPADRAPARSLIPVGGGKDSALCTSILSEADLFAVNAPGASQRVADAAGRPLLAARRTIDPTLRTLNDQGALNGHVPVTAITSAISLAVAVLHGYGDVVMGIERSASEPTRVEDGVPINHQHAKSWSFEQVLGDAAAVATGGAVRWFSLLRPFSELAIARALVSDAAQMGAFLSCNRAFTLWRETEQSRTQTWCLECPKCLFTFLCFAPFLSVADATATFGGNPLADPARTDEVAALWSRDGKPFECVGEVLESAVALATIAERSDWAALPVVAATASEATALVAANDASMAELLTPAGPDRIPGTYRARTFARLAPEPS